MRLREFQKKLLPVLLASLLVFAAPAASIKVNGESVGEWQGEADISWYHDDGSEFTIDTPAQLTGVSVLAAGGTTFTGQIIKIGTDLVLNKGDASDWRNAAPTMTWTPIRNFAGTFDGQGHTISGLYCGDSQADQVGLFANLTGATVKNIIIRNSFFRGSHTVGSFAGVLNGSSPSHLEGLYSDAHLFVADQPSGANPGSNFGGIAGLAEAGTNGSSFSQCWFDGFIFTNGKAAGGILANGSGCSLNVTNCMNSGAITALDEVGGILGCGGGAGNETVLADCLSARSITVITTTEALAGTYLGAMAGIFRNGGSLTLDDCYYLAGIPAFNKVDATVTSDAAALNLVKAIGETAKISMAKLDFTSTWMTMDNALPRLCIFAQADVDAPIWDGIPDISWYDENKKVFLIDKPAQLAGLSALAAGGQTFSGKIIRLSADLDMNRGKAFDWISVAPSFAWVPVVNFSGTFDGQGHTISGFYTSSRNSDPVGLFANLDGATIKNINIRNSLFQGVNSVGSIAGEMSGNGSSKIEGVYSDAFVIDANDVPGSIPGDCFGGIVGSSLSGADGSLIHECWFDGVVFTTGKHAGGILGHGHDSTVKILNGMNTGSVTGLDEVGGILGSGDGSMNKTMLADCVSVGDANSIRTGESVGSLVGLFTHGDQFKINSCYYLQGTTSCHCVDGSAADHSIGLTSAEMTGDMACINMTSLNFGETWIPTFDSYPRLSRFAQIAENTQDKSIIYQSGKVWDGSVDFSWYDQSLQEFTITTPAQLAGLAALTLNGLSFVNTTIKLGADIILNTGDADEYEAVAPPNMWTPIRYFSGTFDGQGHKISGMYIVDVNRSGIGLFANVKSGTVKNVAIVNSYIKGKTYVGSLAGFVDRGYSTISGIYSNAIVKSTEAAAGGIIGFFYSAHDSVVSQCHFDGTVYGGGKYCGGIVGNGNSNVIQIRDCAFTGSVTANDEIGGIIGRNGLPFTINGCYSTGMIASHAGGTKLGHILGLIRSTNGSNPLVEINNCYYPSGTAIPSANSDNWGIGRLADHSVALPLEAMTGAAAASYMAGLDFNTVWTTVDSSTPELQDFADLVPAVAFHRIPDISGDFIEAFNIPESLGGNLKGIYNCGDGYYEILVDETTLGDYQDFLTALTDAGYSTYATNQIENNFFATYTSDELLVHTYFVGCQNSIKIVIGPRGALPGLESENIYTPVTTTLLTQQDVIYGMSYIIRLADGSFIIIDGGYHHPGECEKLYNTLKAQANGEDIVIAAWLFTHQHVDHTGMFSAFFDLYAAEVTVERLIYNFPSANTMAYLDAAMIVAKDLLPKFYHELEIVKQIYPNMEIIKAHTGQEFFIRNANIEILYSPEDYFPGAYGVVDSASIVFRMSIEGQKLMFIGDVYLPVDNILGAMYGDYLKSDYMQVAHHGYVYGADVTALYELIDPAVVFFPTQASRLAAVLTYNSNVHLLNNMNVQEAYFMSEGPATFTLPYTPEP